MNKNLVPLRVENDLTHAIQMILHKRMNKKQSRVIETSYGRNKNLDEIKNIPSRIPEMTRRAGSEKKHFKN